MSSYTMNTADLENEFGYRSRTAPLYSSSDKEAVEREKKAQRNAYEKFLNTAQDTFQTLSSSFLQAIPFQGLGYNVVGNDNDNDNGMHAEGKEQEQEEEGGETTISFSDVETEFMSYFNDPYSYSPSLSILAFLLYKFSQISKISKIISKISNEEKKEEEVITDTLVPLFWKELQTNTPLQHKLTPTSQTTLKDVMLEVGRYVYFFQKHPIQSGF